MFLLHAKDQKGKLNTAEINPLPVTVGDALIATLESDVVNPIVCIPIRGTSLLAPDLRILLACATCLEPCRAFFPIFFPSFFCNEACLLVAVIAVAFTAGGLGV